MQRRELLGTAAILAVGAAGTLVLPLGRRPALAQAKWRIGFSQVTTIEPWRVQFNKDIKAEAAKHPPRSSS